MPRERLYPSGLATLMVLAMFSTVSCVDNSQTASSDPASQPATTEPTKNNVAETEPVPIDATTTETSGQPVAKMSLDEGTWKDVETLVAESSGKIVVVDVWSTSCSPCMKEFPHLLELQKTHSDDVVCVSMNVDYIGIKSKPPSFYRPRVEKFLTSQESKIKNFLSTTDSDTFFDERKLASIPAVYVYDQAGALAKRFDDSISTAADEESFTYERDINPFVAQLLSK